jgi:hypothetical protein
MIVEGAGAALQMTDMRFVIRVLRLRYNGKILDAIWTEFMSLPNHKEPVKPVRRSNPHLEKSVGSCTRVAKESTKAAIGIEGMEHIGIHRLRHSQNTNEYNVSRGVIT